MRIIIFCAALYAVLSLSAIDEPMRRCQRHHSFDTCADLLLP